MESPQAATPWGDVRHSGPSVLPRRLRRRGPRSYDALLRRCRTNASQLQPSQTLEPTVIPESAPSGDPCESGSAPLGFEDFLSVFHLNVQGFFSHADELNGYLSILPKLPTFVSLKETFLKPKDIAKLPGYTIVDRRDRNDGRECGEIILLARAEY